MYTTREFWRNVAINNPNPQIVREVYDNHLLSYNREIKRRLHLNYLDFDSKEAFERRLKEMEQRVKHLGLSGVSIGTRRSDGIQLEDEYLQSLGYKKLVELSECGTVIDNQMVNNLASTNLPDEYELRRVTYDELIEIPGIYDLIFDHFPEGFAQNTEELERMMQSHYKFNITNETIEYYFVIFFRDNLVGYAKGQQETKGPKKDLLHLNVGVTHQDHRQRGLYKILLHARISEGQKNGAKFVYTESDVNTSRPILERLGLKEFDRMKIYQSE